MLQHSIYQRDDKRTVIFSVLFLDRSDGVFAGTAGLLHSAFVAAEKKTSFYKLWRQAATVLFVGVMINIDNCASDNENWDQLLNA